MRRPGCRVVKKGSSARASDLRAHSRAVVGDLDEDPAAGRRLDGHPDLALVGVALGEGLCRVEEEVEEHLAEAPLARHDRGLGR